MERSELLIRIQEVFQDVLENDNIILEEHMTAADIDGWTSLSQAQILTAIEQDLGIRFSLMEIMSMKSVGQIVDSVANKLDF